MKRELIDIIRKNFPNDLVEIETNGLNTRYLSVNGLWIVNYDAFNRDINLYINPLSKSVIIDFIKKELEEI
jgi:hypothetical protein